MSSSRTNLSHISFVRSRLYILLSSPALGEPNKGSGPREAVGDQCMPSRAAWPHAYGFELHLSIKGGSGCESSRYVRAPHPSHLPSRGASVPKAISPMRHSVSVWPKTGLDVWTELRRPPGRLALVGPPRTSDPGAEPGFVALSMARLQQESPLSVGWALTAFDKPPTELEVIGELSGHPVLVDLDVLFEPELGLNPLRLLRRLVRAGNGVIAVWPGNISKSEIRYSTVGRRDHYQAPLSDCLILHPRSTFFDDQAPFDLERVP